MGTIIFGIVGCGKTHERILSEYGTQYVSKTNKNADGSNIGINVKSVTKGDDSIDIETESTFKEISYANNTYIACSIVDEEGNKYSDLSTSVTNVEGQGTITVTGDDIDKGKYIEIIPYKDNDGEYILYEIKQN